MFCCNFVCQLGIKIINCYCLLIGDTAIRISICRIQYYLTGKRRIHWNQSTMSAYLLFTNDRRPALAAENKNLLEVIACHPCLWIVILEFINHDWRIIVMMMVRWSTPCIRTSNGSLKAVFFFNIPNFQLHIFDISYQFKINLLLLIKLTIFCNVDELGNWVLYIGIKSNNF